MNKVLQVKDVWRSPVRCVTAETAAAPSFWLLHTAKGLGSALAGIAGSQCLALGINISGGTFLSADVSWVLVRRVRSEGAAHRRCEGRRSPVSMGRLGGTLFGYQHVASPTIPHIQRHVRPLVVSMLKGMVTAGEVHHLNCFHRLWSHRGSDVRLVLRSLLRETCRLCYM